MTSALVPRAPLDRPETVGDVAQPCPAVGPATLVPDVETVFRRHPELRAVAVPTRAGLGLLTRHRLYAMLSGEMGYGRALLSRAPVASVVEAADVTLTPETRLVHAAAAVLTRSGTTRYDDLLVVDAAGVTSAIPVAAVLQEASLWFREVSLRDPLTGLPNRRWLDEHGAALLAAGADPARLAVLYVDLDGFKEVNDTLGHRAGDELLVEFASRLTASVRPGDLVGRLGGDEFAVLLTEISDVEAMAVADRVVLVSMAPFVVGDQSVRLSASVGVALGREVADEAVLSSLDVLLRHADSAMLHVKRAGKARAARLDRPEWAALPARRAAIRRRLASALRHGELELHYQPKLDLGTDTVTSVEALVRWYDADLGPVSPAEFIPVAEHSGQIHELGRWVRQAACRQARRWHDEGRSWAVAVNVSSVELAGPDLAAEVLAVLAEHGLHPQSLEVEVTETSAVADLPLARRHLGTLRDAGVRVHLDDFGTGYSSFAMLRQLPVSTVKIDRSIVDGIDSSVADAQLLAGVINAAHSLGLRVVAEGVERPEQLDRLRDLGCDSAQGFLICRPRRAGELAVTPPLAAEAAGRVTPPHPPAP